MNKSAGKVNGKFLCIMCNKYRPNFNHFHSGYVGYDDITHQITNPESNQYTNCCSTCVTRRTQCNLKSDNAQKEASYAVYRAQNRDRLRAKLTAQLENQA